MSKKKSKIKSNKLRSTKSRTKKSRTTQSENSSASISGKQDSAFGLPTILALLPTRDVVAIPGLMVPVSVSDGNSADAVKYALDHGEHIALTQQTGADQEGPTKTNLSIIGTYAKISHSIRLPNGDLRIRLQVLGRIRIERVMMLSPFVKVKVFYIPEERVEKLSSQQARYIERIKERFSVLAKFEPSVEEISFGSREIYDPGVLADLIGSALPLAPAEAQAILEEQKPYKRLESVASHLNTHIDLAAIKERVSNRAEKELGRMQHEELLREQMRQIQAELGTGGPGEDDLIELKSKLEALQLPDIPKREAMKQFNRLEQMHSESSEAALLRTYLDWISDLPWHTRTEDRLNLKYAKRILEEDHFGLEKTKERILDFLGVRKLKEDLRGPILLLVGPPGVGKTSLGRSIARALGRKFVRVSVGGLRDEAELRGHRRTYIGALPGRIIQGLKTAGTNNPVFMLDEVDKIGSDFRGDPASVLLEILDPEQNKAFEDHYLNVPFDLSQVMFVCTANITDTVPAPLLDRMEVIDIAGYTTEEKMEIARKYLVPRERIENGLGKTKIDFSEKALLNIIENYTRESGVREFGRMISAVFRKQARLVAEKKRAPRVLTPKVVEGNLGVAKYISDQRLAQDQIGVATGLAWTSVGGEILTIEISVTKGKGSLSLTGQMGEVMRESAQAALTYVMANAPSLGINPDFYETANVHVHVPQGAIPKDGPSAGIAIATALVSVLSQTPISRNVAMTGEITLRGGVLAIGGLKEKALAALRVGIPLVIIPKDNERELTEFPKYLLRKVKFVPVKSIDDVLSVALTKRPGVNRSGVQIERRSKRPGTTIQLRRP